MRRRAIIRLTTQFILDYVGMLSRLFDQDIVKGLVFLAIGDANIGYIDAQPELAAAYGGLDAPPPDEMRRPIRPHKLALSLGVPRETVRRKVGALIEEGWLVECDQGVYIPVKLVTSEKAGMVAIAITQLLTVLYNRLARLGVEGAAPAPADISGLPHRAMARVTTGYCLRSLDEIRQLFSGDLLTGYIYCSVLAANTNYLDELPIRAYVDLDDHVPDELRRPISALALAARTGLPRETVRRHVRKLEHLSALKTVPGGLIGPQAYLRNPKIVGATVRNAVNLRLLLQELQAVGFPRPIQAEGGQRAVVGP